MQTGSSLIIVFAGSVSRREAERLLVRYVDIHSVNPAIDGGPGEAALASALVEDLAGIGLAPERVPVGPAGRDNIVARLEGAPGAPAVMYQAHLDTVGLSGNARAEAVVGDGMVHGRGSCDTKGSLAAIVMALRLLADVPASDRATVVAVGGIDEEVSCQGASSLAKWLGDEDRFADMRMAVIGEPTDLRVVSAHKGVVRFEIATVGSPAHSSVPHLGRNAIDAMAGVLDALADDYAARLTEITHPLVGSPTVSVSTISGGTALNVVPAECAISIDRRIVPGESPEEVLAGLDRVLDSVDTRGCVLERRAPFLVTEAVDTDAGHPLVGALGRARQAILGDFGTPAGVTFGSDASIFAPAGIDCVVFGPGSIDQAHADEEWVSVEETARAGEILAQTALNLANSAR